MADQKECEEINTFANSFCIEELVVEERNDINSIKAQAETKINQLVMQVHSFHDELISKSRRIEFIGKLSAHDLE